MTSAVARREAAAKFLAQRIDYEKARMPYDPARIGLARMHQLLERLDRPERKYAVVHVAGTKGKGSTSAMIASILSAAGFKTGLYTSPHLHRVEERLQIDGRPCSDEEFASLIEAIRPVVEAMDSEQAAGESGPTWFEIITAAAMLHFARQQCRAVVLEVGLGGRLDATNVCRPQVAVITSISFDHTQQLGNTLHLIATEKAGIVKPATPTVCGTLNEEAQAAIQTICLERGSALLQLGRDFNVSYHPPRHLEVAPASAAIEYRSKIAESFALNGHWELALIGKHQAANAATALAVIEQLRTQCWSIGVDAVQAGLLAVSWPARLEIASRHPVVVIDGAHNVASIEALLETLDESFSVARRFLIFASAADKDVAGMLAAVVDGFDDICFTRFSNNPRAMPPEELQAMAFSLRGRRWPVAEGPWAAFEMLRAQATENDLICVAGSLFLAAELRQNFASPSTIIQL